eukprot:183895-Heterocapsa_arctica.AAC.1
MFHITTQAKAAAELGSKLRITALAVLREGPESLRVVHDGTQGMSKGAAPIGSARHRCCTAGRRA